jgi:O-acetyl-ADP-ribose deacetylase (regulator of RNase III)
VGVSGSHFNKGYIVAIKEIYGDLIQMGLDKKIDVLVHGCNCFNNMGSGIAVGVKENFPEAYEVDQQTVCGTSAKIGTYTTAESKGIVVVNAYTQYGYGPKGVTAEYIRTGISKGGRRDHFDYTGFRDILRDLKDEFAGKHIGFPLIGAGLAGGEWERIMAMIGAELAGENVTIVHYNRQ